MADPTPGGPSPLPPGLPPTFGSNAWRWPLRSLAGVRCFSVWIALWVCVLRLGVAVWFHDMQRARSMDCFNIVSRGVATVELGVDGLFGCMR